MWMTAIGSFCFNDDGGFAPVQLSDVTTSDRNRTGGNTAGVVIPVRQREKESSVHGTPIDLAFQDGGMCLLCIGAFRAYLDLLTKQLLPGIDHQCPDILPNIKHSILRMNPLNIRLSHQVSPLG